ncbi:MAG: winged helix-turn-helix domain-containing protein [Candidatus Parvarchaeota archaeon]|jgi:DNA-binding MarR family transcriptional regulator|nr:winged helix-turn-helix domain-containing protein [Candidatus Parvarchaeota archaeon]MCL5101064.1 winged helix-turn-helix domain-containing protein [Candidatus Parvarchaeota archaeon]
MEANINLNESDLKALSSSQRLRIMKSISYKPKTPSDIAEELEKKTPTIIEHLNLLIANGFVVKLSTNDRKYVFYTLSEKGKSLVNSSKKITIILPIALIFISLASLLIIINFATSQQVVAQVVVASASSTGGPQPSQNVITALSFLFSFGILFAGTGILFAYFLLNRRLLATM